MKAPKAKTDRKEILAVRIEGSLKQRILDHSQRIEQSTGFPVSITNTVRVLLIRALDEAEKKSKP